MRNAQGALLYNGINVCERSSSVVFLRALLRRRLLNMVASVMAVYGNAVQRYCVLCC